MPATKFSVLESQPVTALRPGETSIRLKNDPYYGKVDVGPAEFDTEWEKTERVRISTLPAEERAAAEEKLTKDLAARKTVSDAATKDWEKKERARISQLPAPERPAAEEKLSKDLAARKARGEAKGDVDMGFKPGIPAQVLLAKLDALQDAIDDGAHALDGEEQSHVEVITGKRLQQRAQEPRPPEPAVDPEHEGLKANTGAKVQVGPKPS